MANKSQLSGMRGVYLVAAELVARGFIVSVTSRSAAGADLPVTDDTCARAWSVQVKATDKPTVRAHATYRLLVYVFVSLRRDGAQFYVVPSRVVANQVRGVQSGRPARGIAGSSRRATATRGPS